MFTLNAQPRNLDESVKKLRNKGIIPGTIYGQSVDSTNLQIDQKQLQKCLKTGALKVDLELGQSKYHAKIQDVQWNPIGTKILHVSFHAFAANEKISMEIPVHVTGKAKGQMDGGIVKLQTDHITVYGTPSTLPESFELDIKDLELGSSIHIEDIANNLPYEIKTSMDTVLVACHYPKLEVVAEEPEAELETVETEEVSASAETQQPEEEKKAA
jgi:large subunit ribosomal protein L25